MKISACVLTKDDGASLARCLESVCDVVDEIIVVDNGVNPKTQIISNKYGAKVYSYPFDSFSFKEARNFAIEKATGVWILGIDSDEALANKSKENLSNLVKDSQKSYAFLIQNYYPNGRFSSFPVTRLFPNKKEIEFEKDIHETVNYSLERTGVVPEISTIYVHHFGYLEDNNHLLMKNRSYTKRLETQLSKHPDDAASWWYYALSLAVAKKFNDSFNAIEQAINLDSFNKIPRTFKARFYMVTDNYTLAISTLEEALEIQSQAFWNPTLYNLLGMLYIKQNAVNHAKDCFLNVIKEEKNFAHAWINLGIAYFKEGDKDNALNSMVEASQLNPFLFSFSPISSHRNIYAFQEDVTDEFTHIRSIIDECFYS
ncbi:glycosyltransferase [Shouchella shacheensis]|uniref:glycosyltransferase n=1 Tax=Shouchella shacheensis TaxID=1649580 RepID=UPI0007401D85|nr:tetratricopeptide repeat protein [Shouchella shacheensis]